ILDDAGFDEAMVTALRAEDVLGADESPVNVVDNLNPDGTPAAGSAHLITVRTPDPRLVWYQAITSRSGQNLKDLGIFVLGLDGDGDTSLPELTLGVGGRVAIVTQGPTPYDEDACMKLDGDVVEELEAVVAALG
ncbi:MAG: hypothetical protein GEU88_20670, partial [Solirubrobacterales bacterium]|nr:hypothetical protein [Solirubrobacterales bacterium]